MVSNIDVCVEAQKYALLGFEVLPLYGVIASQCSCSKRGRCTSPGKHPATFTGVKEATADPDQIDAWFSIAAPRNVGIATGGYCALLVVDIDPRNGGDATLASLERSHGRLPQTVTTETGGGGLHYYFKTKILMKKTRSLLGPGIDTCGERSYVVAPPSVHFSGDQYLWSRGLDPFSIAIAPAPLWILKGLRTPNLCGYAGSYRTNWEQNGCLLKGVRNNGLTQRAGRYWLETGDHQEVLSRLLRDNELICKPPVSQAEVAQVARSVCRYPRNRQAFSKGGNL